MPRGGVPKLPPYTRKISYGGLVKQAWGDEWGKKDIGYEFSNGRKFQVSEPNGSVYTGTATGS